MKNVTLMIALAASLALGTSLSQAAPVVTVTAGTTSSGASLFVFNVDPNGTTLDTIDITLTTTDAFSNTETVPATVLFSPAGTADDTDVLGLNTVALGWSILGTSDDANTFAAAGGPLGLNITAPVDFAQAVFASSSFRGVYTFNFADNGQLVGTATGEFGGVPEPGTLALAGLSLIGLLGSRRRRDV